MRSPVAYRCQWQAQLLRGGGGGGCRSVSIGGSRSVALLRPPRAAPINTTLSLSASTKPNHDPDLLPIPPLHSLPSSPPPPWLMVPSSYFNKLDQKQDLTDHYPYCFVLISDNKIFRLDKAQVPSQMRHPWDHEFFFPDDTEFCGSSLQGWVFMKHPRTHQMFLINPLYPSDSIVPLPPIHSFDSSIVAGSVTKSSVWSYRDNPSLSRQYIRWEASSGMPPIDPKNPSKPMRHRANDELHFYLQFAMSSFPSDPACTVLVENYGELYFWKPGHKSWTQLYIPNIRYHGDCMVYSNTHRCFYVIDVFYEEKVDAWKWESDSPQPERISRLKVSPPRPPPRGDIECKRFVDCWNSDRWENKGKFLVESPSGDLLLVIMLCFDENEDDDVNKYVFDPQNFQFFVFTLNFEESKWEPVKSLGREGYALFVGHRYGLCVPVADYAELKPNHIYYSSNFCEIMASTLVVEFNMEDDTSRPYRFTDHLGRPECPSIWLLPNPNSEF